MTVTIVESIEKKSKIKTPHFTNEFHFEYVYLHQTSSGDFHAASSEAAM